MSEQLQLGMTTFDLWRELDARVLEALKSPLLTEKEREILRVIARHKGAAQAIRSRVVADEAGIYWNEEARRSICRAIETFVMLMKLPIGALREAPYGYFLIVSAEDLDLAVRPLVGEFRALLRRFRALTSPKAVAKLYGQEMLKLRKEEAAAAAAPKEAA